MVVNGGYPAGETCRIANIVWGKINRFSSKKKTNIHNFHNYATPPRFGFKWFEDIIDQKVYDTVDCFISVSNSCSNSLKNRSVFSNYERVYTIYNGVSDMSSKINYSLPDLRKELKIGDAPLCIILANYEKRKGHYFLFKAFSKVVDHIPNAQLVCCGGSTHLEKKHLLSILNKMDIKSNIHILDFIENGNHIIKQADGLLISSQNFESFGLTAVEAMLNHVPVVATNVGGLPEVLGQPPIGGYLIEANDFIKFAEKVIYLLSNSKFRRLVGNEGNIRAKSLFTAERMANEYYKALNTKNDQKNLFK